MLAILSDIHSNLPALEAVVADARMLGCTRFISLGDVVGYGAQPGECIDLLRSLDAVNIMGNHDSFIATEENCSRSRTVAQIISYQRSILSSAQVDWLKCSVNYLVESDTMYVHGGPDDPKDQYIYTVSREIVPDGVRLLFAGHTHVQILADLGDRIFCNPGSVGQPRDGDPRTGYAVMNGGEVELRRFAYDVERAVAASKAAGFEPFCYDNLYDGTQIGGRIDKIEILRS